MLSFTDPTAKVASTRDFWATRRTMPVASHVRNPLALMFKSYVPAGRPGTEYSPSELLTVARVRVPDSLLDFTVALGIAAPLLSRTDPVMTPLSCANAARETPKMNPNLVRRDRMRLRFLT